MSKHRISRVTRALSLDCFGVGWMEVGILDISMFAHIQTFALLLWSHTQTDDGFEDRKRDQGDRKHIRGCCENAVDLRKKLRESSAHEKSRLHGRCRGGDGRIRKESHGQRAKHTVYKVDG